MHNQEHTCIDTHTVTQTHRYIQCFSILGPSYLHGHPSLCPSLRRRELLIPQSQLLGLARLTSLHFLPQTKDSVDLAPPTCEGLEWEFVFSGLFSSRGPSAMTCTMDIALLCNVFMRRNSRQIINTGEKMTCAT